MQLQCTYSTTGNDAVALGGPVNAGDTLTMFPQGVCFLPLGAIPFVDLHLMVIQRQCKTCGWSRSFVHMLMTAAADTGDTPQSHSQAAQKPSHSFCAVALCVKPKSQNITSFGCTVTACNACGKDRAVHVIRHCCSQSQHRPAVSLGLHNCPAHTALDLNLGYISPHVY